MKVNSGLDIMFGVRGTYENIRTKDVDSLLKECQGERELYAEMAKKIYLYSVDSVQVSDS